MTSPEADAVAGRLLACYERLASVTDAERLREEWVRVAAQLAGVELAQLYLLDAGGSCLQRVAQSLDGHLVEPSQHLVDHDHGAQPLLQFSLCQGRPLNILELDEQLHEIGFLPAVLPAWCSLLCLPLQDEGRTLGLLVCASRQRRELISLQTALQRLDTFALAQLALRRAPMPPASDERAVEPAPALPGHYGLIGDGPAMQTLYRLLARVLHNDVCVLLSGETGTGKELVARAIHERGARRQGRFVAQNCAALPEALLESELFGYRKGAFTGAQQDRPGLFDAADGGTLFLDEVGDMPLALQAKLLRVLQEGEVRPLGSLDAHRVDVRIVAATHHELRQAVEQGRFRADLYYRLAHFPIDLPPLRERGEDVLRLARHFAEQAARLLQRGACRWSDAALEQLCGYAFPGNVRELKGLVERAVLLCDGGELLPEHLGLMVDGDAQDSTLNLRQRLERVERGLLLDSLRRNQGNQSHAARELGLPRRTLLYRMQRLQIRAADV